MIYILLPCYNEYKNLVILVEKINKLTIKNSYKIKLIIVNDGSTDETDIKINQLHNKSKFPILYIKHKKFGTKYDTIYRFRKIFKDWKKDDIIVSLDSDNIINFIDPKNNYSN